MLMEAATSSSPNTRIALVTGGNKGIGIEACKQLASNGGITVVLTARDQARGTAAVEELKRLGFSHVIFHQLDITDALSIARLAEFLKNRFQRLDILVNNAAIGGTERPPLCPVDKKQFRNEELTQELNNIDHLTEKRLDELLDMFLRDFETGRVQVRGWPAEFPAYKVAKAALNAYSRILARRHPVLCVNCADPGFTKTNMTLTAGLLTPEEGAHNVVRVALLPDGELTGAYFHEGQQASFL